MAFYENSVCHGEVQLYESNWLVVSHSAVEISIQLFVEVGKEILTTSACCVNRSRKV